MSKRILFLGYDREQTQLMSCLEKQGCIVDHTQEKLNSPDEYGHYDFMISFGYKYLIKKQFIDAYQGDILNLHVAYLPWNRGSQPNFWAFLDNTPHGVTIHLIDEGIDTGPILYQRYVNFDSEKTFSESHNRLLVEIEELFIKNINEIVANQYIPKPQRGRGSYHSDSDLPDFPGGWNADVESTLGWLDKNVADFVSERLMVIDQVESIRSKNNVNWMDVLRLAFKHAPKDAAGIMGRINSDDSKISELLHKLSSKG